MRLLILLLLFSVAELTAQEMTPAKLTKLIEETADTTFVRQKSIQFKINDAMLICIYDENANRMRIISPIAELKDVQEGEILNAMVANFHTALDVKYALSEEIIWSVFAHPLKQLSDEQVLDALKQVYAASITFGSSYSSTDMVFPGAIQKKPKPKPLPELNKI
ncbi:hypothetical protein [Croceivirga thetidis]|uniref:Uncharacterized protein n=1 Tax=Croceivirga thetidis TaxID=2721623 RepID=A0ABX1GSB1_9FLAO|nr:hypothetical protein [Croceivirga thetidis]NKI31946.1 hypothetical protein [Croceivirga thetidis]